MGVLKKMLAAGLAFISIIAAVQLVAAAIYGGDSSGAVSPGGYLNWLIGLGFLIVLVCQIRQKRYFDRQNRSDSVTFSYLFSNLSFFAAIFLALWFFAYLAIILSGGRGSFATVGEVVWIFCNAGFVVLGMVTVGQMWEEELPTSPVVPFFSGRSAAADSAPFRPAPKEAPGESRPLPGPFEATADSEGDSGEDGPASESR